MKFLEDKLMEEKEKQKVVGIAETIVNKSKPIIENLLKDNSNLEEQIVRLTSLNHELLEAKDKSEKEMNLLANEKKQKYVLLEDKEKLEKDMKLLEDQLIEEKEKQRELIEMCQTLEEMKLYSENIYHQYIEQGGKIPY